MNFIKKWIIIIVITIILITISRSYSLYKTQRIELKYNNTINQVYKSFLIYSPIFLWSWSDTILSNQNSERVFFDDIIKNYYRDIKNKKVYKLYGYKKYILTWVDYDTFTPLNYEWARDNKYLYLDGERTPFDLSLNPKFIGSYLVDDNYIYNHNYKPIIEGDRKSFEYILINWQLSQYYKDKDHIYGSMWIITWADIDSFEVVDIWYGKDKKHIYRYDWILSWADVDSFEVLWNNYSKDKNNTYYHNKTLTWADIDSFEVVWHMYAKDKLNYYKFWEKISLDPNIDIDDRCIYINQKCLQRDWRDPEEIANSYQ